MRIALCYSGQLRSGPYCFDNHREFFGDLWPFVDIFIHTWSNNSNKRFDKCGVDKDTQIPSNIMRDHLAWINPKVAMVECWPGWAEWNKKKIPYFPLVYSFLKSINLKQMYEHNNGVKYDVVVKLRPDIIVDPKRSIGDDIAKAVINNAFLVENLSDNWESEIFSDDVLYVAPNHLMDVAGNFNPGLEKLILVKWLASQGVSVKRTLGCGYTIYRRECYHLSPKKEFTLCQECDNQHFNCDSDKYRADPAESSDYYDNKYFYENLLLK